MEFAEEEKGLIWLCACSGLDHHRRVVLLRAVKDPAALLSRADLSSIAGKELSPPAKRKEELDEVLSLFARKNYFAVPCTAEDYPEVLRHITEPPVVLFGAGRRELLKKKKFCIVGSRVTPPWAEAHAKAISSRIAEHFAVVTGLAEGGDSAAIAGALPSGNLISVLPCGLEECYPAAHASLKERVIAEGLLLTECAPREQGKKYEFYARNRILAGIAEGVLVVSAGEKSGALITANYAIDYGRDVFAFPHDLGSAQGAGCNALIQKGAYLVRDAEDILSWYGIAGERRAAPDLTEEESRVLAILKECGSLHTAVLAERAGLRVFEIASVLSSLEVKGLAVKAGGNRYTAL